MAKQYGFLINMEDCYGCNTCAVACKSENSTPKDVEWRRVRKFPEQMPNTLSFISMSCNHCEFPKCQEVCPVGAYQKREDGVVIQDHDRCIGCRMCIMACPYGAPVYDPVEGKTSKCHLCFDRLDHGALPRCVEACPGKVLKFGELEKLREEYGADLQPIVQRFGLPDPAYSSPSIVVIAPKNNK